jgi:hypothetical protein
MATFWEGFGSVLSLSREDAEDLRFEYKGKDLSTITAADALNEDWNLVVAVLPKGKHDIRER